MTIVVIGSDTPAVRALAEALAGELVPLPASEGSSLDWAWAQALEAWRDEVGGGPGADHVVVAAWEAEPVAAELLTIGQDEWVDRAERPLARWTTALAGAVAGCADGGAVVAVVDRPSPLDCAGWAPESAVADAVEALTRSLARSEGPRGVRVNAVTTPARVLPHEVVEPAPSLATFPGSVADVAGAVRLLLDGGASGLTGTVLHADHGRSWR